MVRNKNHQDQLSFDDITEPHHDYSQEVEGEYPMVIASSYSKISEADGVSVSLAKRAEVLEGASSVYARYARARGLGKAVLITAERAKLERRYEDVDRVSSNAQSRAFYTTESTYDHPSDEQRMLEGLLKTRQLEENGFSRNDIDEAVRQTIIGVRHAIGVDVGNAKRQANIKIAKDTLRNSQLK
ncbi:MAG: hypothetical protein WAW80_04330 [Candidatus Saccharimonadales bacterium]